jgi:hypothetical protein
MTDPHAIWNWLAAHLQALFYVIVIHAHAAVERIAPPVQAVLAWIDAHLQAAIAWARPAVRSAIDAVEPYAATVAEFLSTHWRAVALFGVAAIAAAAFARWMRHRHRIKATLVEVSLDRDPKTAWLKLNIVLQNFQSHALVVRSLCVEQPAGAMICEHWKAWQPRVDGVRFIAGELDLTNEAEIERTIMPNSAGGKHVSLATVPALPGHDDQLVRSFYLQAPAITGAEPVKVRAVLHCELQAGNGRKQILAFQRMLDPVEAQDAAAILS